MAVFCLCMCLLRKLSKHQAFSLTDQPAVGLLKLASLARSLRSQGCLQQTAPTGRAAIHTSHS